MTAPALPRSNTSLQRRLMPLYLAVFLQGFLLWVPVEKLFMSEIGFDPASVGLMAAAYAAVVPIIEIPSGILADRWSRRGVLIISSIALGLCALIGGLSNNVATYIVSALILGVYFAMYSGRWTPSSTTLCSKRPATATTSRNASGGYAWWRPSPWWQARFWAAGWRACGHLD